MKSIILLVYILSFTTARAKEGLNFNCGGTEPNWGLNIRGNEIQFSSPEKNIPKIKLTETKLIGSEIQIKAKSPQGQQLYLQINNDIKCTDGMSENKSTHRIEFTLGKVAYSGCCNQIKITRHNAKLIF
jgi:uncharacterized membrane protein